LVSTSQSSADNGDPPMRAARWHGRGDVRVEDVPQPVPGPGELLLRVSWCGICGTDLEEYLDGPSIIPVEVPNGLTGRVAPLTLGHEFVGAVAALGEGVLDFRIGERVAPEVVLFCGQCSFCRRHEYALCVNWAAIDLMADGGLAEYVVVPAFACVRLPDTLSDEDGALVEPTEVAVRAVRKSDLRLGEAVAVVGGGAVGLLTLQVARAGGAGSAYLIEPRAARRELGLTLGATAAFDPIQPNWQQELREACRGVGPDVVFECAGASETADLAVRIARKGGRIVLLGIHAARVPLSTLDLIVGEKHVIGSVQHHFDEDLPVAVQLLAERKVQVGSLITAREPLGRVVAGGFQALVEHPDQYLKVLIGPQL
jgi:(R,R)-butanediol dehydrogenase / meso-butanediol dehydrogenase / diacetyl reductase